MCPTGDNIQAVTRLLRAVNECASILRDTGKYYRDMEKDLNGLEEFITSSPPSDDEAEIARSHWAEFLDTSMKVLAGVSKLRVLLKEDPWFRLGKGVPGNFETMRENPSQPRTSFLHRLLSCLSFRGFG